MIEPLKTFDIILDDIEVFPEPKKVTVQVEIIAPQPGGQVDALSRPEFEMLYGGAAGPGKTWVLVVDALGLQYQKEEFGMAAYMHPRYRAVLFRRTSTRLQNLIDECKNIYLPLGAKFVLQRKGEPGASFTFPSGAKIFLCHLEQPKDIESHQGAAYQYVGFDELTQFTLEQYLYLFSRARGVVINNGVSLGKRIRSTTNPTGIGLIWVRKRFIKNQRATLIPGKTYFFIRDPESKDPSDNPMGIEVSPMSPDFVNAKSRTFIPGFMWENKILMSSDPGYAANIMQLGKKMERALKDGDWDAFGGDFFWMFDKHKMEIEPFKIPKSWTLYGSLDPGWSSPCAFTLAARNRNGQLFLLFTYYVRGKDPSYHAASIKNLIENFPYTDGRMPDLIVSGWDAFAKKEKFSINYSDLTFSDIFNDHGLYLQRAQTDRILGWWVVKQYMTSNLFYFFKGFNNEGIDEITAMQTDENNIEEIKGLGNDPSVADHFCDEFRYLCMAIPMPPQWKKLKRWQPELDDYMHKADKESRKKKKQGSVMSA